VSHRLLAIKCKIQLQHVDSRLAEESPLPPLGVLADKTPQAVFRYAARPCDARYLELGCRR
jgi:hypothetical protein